MLEREVRAFYLFIGNCLYHSRENSGAVFGVFRSLERAPGQGKLHEYELLGSSLSFFRLKKENEKKSKFSRIKSFTKPGNKNRVRFPDCWNCFKGNWISWLMMNQGLTTLQSFQLLMNFHYAFHFSFYQQQNSKSLQLK